MRNSIQRQEIITKQKDYIALILWGGIFFVFLLLRDAYSIEINKNIFIVMTILCAFTMQINNLIYLFCFLFPLYVGLPGNYITLILIVRLLFDINKFEFKWSSLILTFLIAAFMFCQNIITGYTGIVPMMFIVGLILVLLFFSYKEKLSIMPMIILYSAGVFALGFIMLISTLQIYDFTDLLSVSFRLGSSNVDYVEKGIMNVSVDPNFYGTFSISAIATTVPLLLNNDIKRSTKVWLTIFSIGSFLICLIGLSRAFVLVFLLWLILYLFSQRNIKGASIVLGVMLLVLVVVMLVIPDVVNAILDRFKAADMETGNGRITLISKFWNLWQDNIITIFFGVGLYNCNVHCMPLQFFFGGGIVLLSLIIMLVITYKQETRARYSLSRILPLLSTFVMMCTVPAAGLLNFMFPIIFVGLLMKYNEKTKLHKAEI